MVQFKGQHAELTERIIGIFYQVTNELGFGFMEVVYRRSMLIALQQAGIKVEEEVATPVYFRDILVGTFYADLVVEDCVILELKTAEVITKNHEAHNCSTICAVQQGRSASSCVSGLNPCSSASSCPTIARKTGTRIRRIKTDREDESEIFAIPC